jgi:hypothetical protein
MKQPERSVFANLFSVPVGVDGFGPSLQKNAGHFLAFLTAASETRRKVCWELFSAFIGLGETIFFTGTNTDVGLRVGLKSVGEERATSLLAICHFPNDGEPYLSWSTNENRRHPELVGHWANPSQQPLFEGDGPSDEVKMLIQQLRALAVKNRGTRVEKLWSQSDFEPAFFTGNLLIGRLPISHPEGGQTSDQHVTAWRASINN